MSFAENLFTVEQRIQAACRAASRPRDRVLLLAVSKTIPPVRLREAALAGQTSFGENYVQEALPKLSALADLPLDWHHIGPIQSNKTADIAAHFGWAQGVDRLRIATRLAGQRPAHLPPLKVCVQVNVSGEASKSGCAPSEALALCRAIAALPGLQLRGLMTLPAPTMSEREARASFRQLRAIYDAARAEGMALDTLSMGMSDDFEAAIAEGATLIRIGSALFGRRDAGKRHDEAAS